MSEADRKYGGRERSSERTFQKTLEWDRAERGAERRRGVTKIGLSTERQIERSRSAHVLCLQLRFDFDSTAVRRSFDCLSSHLGHSVVTR